MATFKATYIGNSTIEVEHIRKNAKILVHSPENKTELKNLFSPTDLLATSLVTCVITTIKIAAIRDNIDLKGMTVYFKKEQLEEILKIDLEINFPEKLNISEKEKMKFENYANACQVKKLLNDNIKIKITFNF